MYSTRKIGLCFFAALILSGCATRRYQPVPMVPNETASRLETRSLGDEDLHAFVEKNVGHAVAPWPPKTWNLATLSLAALYFNPSLEGAKARVEEVQAAIVTAGARPNPSLSVAPGVPFASETVAVLAADSINLAAPARICKVPVCWVLSLSPLNTVAPAVAGVDPT